MDKYENWGTTEKTELYVFIFLINVIYISLYLRNSLYHNNSCVLILVIIMLTLF